jgi:hypothetical protein
VLLKPGQLRQLPDHQCMWLVPERLVS